MSHHRRARHVLGIAVCIAVMVATTGCRRSPFHRLGEDRPTGPDGKPIGYQKPQSALDQASADKPTAPKPAAATPPMAIATTATRPIPVEVTPPSDAQPVAPAETPMLDAALKRAEAIEAEHRRIMRDELEPKPEVQLATFPAPAKKSSSDDGPRRDEAVQRASAEAPAVDKTKLWNAAAELVELLPADLSAAAVPATLPRAVSLLAPTPAPTASSEPEVAPAPTPPPPFAINAVQLCRAIRGFGSFEPMDPRKLRAGRPVLIYCEPAGLRYDQRDEEYVSHVATHFELIAADGSRVWEVGADAEDHCPRLRHDAFVGTQVNLPDTIAPGDYTIRLTHTDRLAQQAATAEIAVTIGH